MAWSIVGVSASVESTTTSITLAEPAGVANGDLLVACFASRSTATTPITNTGWTAVNSSNNNNILTSASAAGSGTMLYQVRAGTPDLSFVIPAGISVCLGRIVAYRGNATTTPLDVSRAALSTSTVAPSWIGLSPTQADDLIVAMTAGGQEASWFNFSATDPAGVSVATNTTTPPSPTAWIERADQITTTGVDTSLGIFDAIKSSPGSTGFLLATASLSAIHVCIAGAFKIAPSPNATVIVTGQEAFAEAGDVGVEAVQHVAPFVSNQLATTSVGTVDVKIGNTGIAESQLATSAVGDVSVLAKVLAFPFGQLATSGVGTVDVTTTLGASTIVTGQEAVASVGTATVATVLSDSVIAASQVATASVGNVSVSLPTQTTVAGQLATVSAGTASVATTTGVSTTVTGQQIVVAQGNVSVAAGGAITAGAASQLATLTVGNVTVDVTATVSGMNVWNGSAWVDRPAKVWTGAVWAQKPVKIWNGSAWL